jgi:hypothetical protein
VRRASLLVAAAVVALAAGPAVADAARCPAPGKGTPAVWVTWGAAAPGEEVDETTPPYGWPSGRVGAASDGTYADALVVRTPQTTRRPYLCAGRTALARLPRLRTGERLVGVSANGDRVAWRLARSARSGRVSVGRIRHGRIVGVRSTPTAATGRLRRRDGRITVTPGGDAAWALQAGNGRRGVTRLWAWPRDGRPRRLRLPADRRGWVSTILLADDQHLFLDTRTAPLTYAPPRPSTCPRLATGTWRAAGSWRVAVVGGFTVGLDVTDTTNLLLVCDPASGRLRHVEAMQASGDPACSVHDPVERVAAHGPWLLLERRLTYRGPQCYRDEVRTVVVDTRTGTTAPADGGIAGPGIVPAPGDPPPGGVLQPADASGLWPAAVVAPGALAWAQRERPHSPGGRRPLMLSDAAGTRRVGTVTTPSLALDSELRWTEDGVARSVPVAPAAGWTPVVASLDGL